MNPYSDLPSSSFWRPSVADKSLYDICDLWHPKFKITKNDMFATYGSCFAQHFSKALRQNKIRWINEEPAPLLMSQNLIEALRQNKIKWINKDPEPFLVSQDLLQRFNYDVYSSRTQNIYTPTMLLQWLKISKEKSFSEIEFWEKDGRYYDPLRPTLEPDGFRSLDELVRAREVTCDRFLSSVKKATIFVFTLGLTERWVNADTGLEYAQCPGISHGEYNADKHVHQNLLFPDLRLALAEAIKLMRSVNPKIKILLTVSPVPLVATFQKKHVLIATMEAKSALRTVASVLTTNLPYVDYFPSYEMISSFPYKATFYEPNLRSVNQAGVDYVMKHFFLATKIASDNNTTTAANASASDLKCEEELLEAFQK